MFYYCILRHNVFFSVDWKRLSYRFVSLLHTTT